VIVVLTPDDTGIKFSPPAPGGIPVGFVNQALKKISDLVMSDIV
jgi:hypothetical protein